MRKLSEKTKNQLEGIAFMSDYVKWRALWISLMIMAGLATWSLFGYPYPNDLAAIFGPEWLTMLGRFLAIGLLGVAGFYRHFARQARLELSYR